VTQELDLSELCALVDVTPRTVHFYIQQGLLPGPDGTGRGAKYGPRHVVRLRLIKRLQKEHLPLAEIRRRLDALTDEEAEALLARTESESPARASALDYVQSVLRRDSPTFVRESRARPNSTPTLPSPPANEVTRSTWEHVILNDDIELHIRRPLSRLRNRQVEKLLAAARDLLKED
jgi:DNA-binding transcriptional MerR regulator